MKLKPAVIVVLLFGLILVPGTHVDAQSKGLSLMIGGGPGLLPMSDFEDWQGERLHHFAVEFENDPVGWFADYAVAIHFDERHSLVLFAEYITIDAKEKNDPLFMFNDELPRYEISAIPAGVSFEYSFFGPGERWRQVAGFGAAMYFGTFRKDYQILEGMDDSEVHVDQKTRGFGAHGYYGLNYRLFGGMFLHSRIKARFTEALTVRNEDDETDETDLDFTGVDLKIGIGWRFGG